MQNDFFKFFWAYIQLGIPMYSRFYSSSSSQVGLAILDSWGSKDHRIISILALSKSRNFSEISSSKGIRTWYNTMWRQMDWNSWLTFKSISGMWKLEVSHNEVSSVPSMAFYGLERALWELHLPHNKLTRIPSESLTLLKKLSVLNLAGKSSPPDSHPFIALSVTFFSLSMAVWDFIEFTKKICIRISKLIWLIEKPFQTVTILQRKIF